MTTFSIEVISMNLKPAIVLAGVCSLLAARSVVAHHAFAAEFDS
jgi:hypothetical protein